MTYSYQKHPISEAEKLWLREIIRLPLFDPRIAKVKLRDKLPKEFDPDRIDPRLCFQGKPTLVGLWHIAPSDPIFEVLHRLITVIRERILESPGINEIAAPEIARITGLDQTVVWRALRALGDLGHFYSGAHGAPDGLGLAQISLTGPAGYDEYLRYSSVDELLERFYVTRDPSKQWMPTRGLLPQQGFAPDMPTTEHKPIKQNTAFVLMAMDPSKPELEDVYAAIKDGCKEFGIVAYRADEIQHQDRITDRILQEIETCEYLVADLTHERPNVYYEVGYAHARNKKPILFRRAGTQLHFDLSVHNVPEYKNATELRQLLRRRLAAILGRDPKATDAKE